MIRPPLRFGVVYDFRNPPDSGIATPRLYAEILEQVAWLDQLGLDLVWFTEHHFVDDGYLPSWTPVAGAMAARTRRVRFSPTSASCRSAIRCASPRISPCSTT